jgi:hypothetical protein
MVRIVGSVLVRNEDLFVERAIRNVSDFCDRIHVVDHVSDDRTWSILRALTRELPHVEVRRARRASESHRTLERYVGTPTWVLGVDGDELFDPLALARLRAALLAGEHADVFRLKAHVLNCERIDGATLTAEGYMAPPARPVTKLFNLAAVESWTGCLERLHDGDVIFRPGYDWGSVRDLSESTTWQDDPLRCLHVCFLERSTRDRERGRERQNLNESDMFDRTPLGALRRRLRPRVPTQVAELHREGSSWKRSWYTRGRRLAVDAAPFLASGAWEILGP